MRLIDADAYCAEMKKRQDACVKWRDEARESGNAEDLIRAEQALSGFIEAKLMLDHAPTVDAVPVVRCKDCKHYQHDAFLDHDWCDGRCVTPDYFCADGERRSMDGGDK